MTSSRQYLRVLASIYVVLKRRGTLCSAYPLTHVRPH